MQNGLISKKNFLPGITHQPGLVNQGSSTGAHRPGLFNRGPSTGAHQPGSSFKLYVSSYPWLLKNLTLKKFFHMKKTSWISQFSYLFIRLFYSTRWRSGVSKNASESKTAMLSNISASISRQSMRRRNIIYSCRVFIVIATQCI